MGFELAYEDSKFYVWSTVVDDFVSGPLDSPREVAEFVLNYHGGRFTSEGLVPYTRKQAEEIYKMWYDEAVKVRRNPEEGLRIAASFRLGPEEEPTGIIYEEPIRVTPKLQELRKKARKGG